MGVRFLALYSDIFKHKPIKGLIYKIFKDLIKLSAKKPNQQTKQRNKKQSKTQHQKKKKRLKSGQTTLIDIFPKKTYK